MEKKTPHYRLLDIKAAFSSVDTLRLSGSALLGARAMGMDLAAIVAVVQSTTRSHFLKSMTSYNDHTIWQDVYHVPAGKYVVYEKFTLEADKFFLLISFKER